jgi:hypothetical protein
MLANRTNTERFPAPVGIGAFGVGRAALAPLAAFCQASGAAGQPAYGVVQGAQGSERLGQLGVGDRFVADEQGVEDGLVDEPADAVVGAAIELVQLFAEDLKRELQGRGDVVVADAQTGNESLGVFAALADAGLFVVE